jgi:TolB protein
MRALRSVLLLVAVAACATAESAFATFGGANGMIAVSTAFGPRSEIATIGVDGSGIIEVTDNGSFDGSPAWSPDGRRVAFETNRNGNYEIYVMNADGTGVVRVTRDLARDVDPQWTAGGRIRFTRWSDGERAVYEIAPDGMGLRRVLRLRRNWYGLVWSPDGSRAAFSSDRIGGRVELYVVNADGTGLRRPTRNLGRESALSWSPDGNRLAFTSQRFGHSPVIAVLDADGTNLTRLTSEADFSTDPVWSPDGRSVAFLRLEGWRRHLYTLAVDGSPERRVAELPWGFAAGLDWQPLPD